MQSFQSKSTDQQDQSQSSSNTVSSPDSSTSTVLPLPTPEEFSMLIKRVTILWKNQYIRIHFDFYRTINELHYYIADCYNFPIVGDFFHRLQYLYPMYSLYSQGIRDDNLLILATDCYDNYLNRHCKEIYPLLFEPSHSETKPNFDAPMKSENIQNTKEQTLETDDDNLSTTCRKSRKQLKECRPLFTKEKKRKECEMSWEITSQCSSLTDSNGDSSSDCKEAENADHDKKFSVDSSPPMDEVESEAVKLLQTFLS